MPLLSWSAGERVVTEKFAYLEKRRGRRERRKGAALSEKKREKEKEKKKRKESSPTFVRRDLSPPLHHSMRASFLLSPLPPTAGFSSLHHHHWTEGEETKGEEQKFRISKIFTRSCDSHQLPAHDKSYIQLPAPCFCSSHQSVRPLTEYTQSGSSDPSFFSINHRIQSLKKGRENRSNTDTIVIVYIHIYRPLKRCNQKQGKRPVGKVG